MEVIAPYWVDENEWEKTKLDSDIIQNVHLNSSLRPSLKEWRAYFKWLLEIVGYPENEVALIKKQKSRHRRISVRVCMFLHSSPCAVQRGGFQGDTETRAFHRSCAYPSERQTMPSIYYLTLNL